MPDALGFDILASLSGYDRPTETVTVFADEDGAYKLQQALKKLTGREGDEVPKALQKEIDGLKDRVRKSKLVFSIRGLSAEEVQAAVDEADKLVPKKFTPYGFPQQDNGRDEEYTNILWAKQITSIENAQGETITAVTPELAKGVRAQLSSHSAKLLRSELDRISREIAEGLDFVMADDDFLS